MRSAFPADRSSREGALRERGTADRVRLPDAPRALSMSLPHATAKGRLPNWVRTPECWVRVLAEEVIDSKRGGETRLCRHGPQSRQSLDAV